MLNNKKKRNKKTEWTCWKIVDLRLFQGLNYYCWIRKEEKIFFVVFVLVFIFRILPETRTIYESQ